MSQNGSYCLSNDGINCQNDYGPGCDTTTLTSCAK